MNLSEIIARKEAGISLSKDEIEKVVHDTASEKMDDDQLTAFLKAVYDNGMDLDETTSLTLAMTNSGYLFNWPTEWAHLVVDKHSTGGVGDKISLPLAPILASCGLKVPMIAGRGLAHTGGTLDKLESIPGFSVNIDVESFRKQIFEIGCAIGGQTSDIAPADRRMYAIRDVTGTIDCLPLIVGSILSKKAAEGLTSLVLDIKVGKAAFMKTEERAIELAKLIVSSGENMGIKTNAVLTKMDAPIGNMIGNSLEVVETVKTLSGEGPDDIIELIHILGGILLTSSNIAKDMDDAKSKIDTCIKDGSALRKFSEMVEWQGGDSRVTDQKLMWDILGIAAHLTPVFTKKSGYIKHIDAMALGDISMRLGAGRINLGDNVKPRVGIQLNKNVGDLIEVGDEIATIHSEEIVNEDIMDKTILAFQLSSTSVKQKSRVIHMS